MDRQLAPAKIYVAIVPMWLRLLLIAATMVGAFYWTFTDSGPFRAVSIFFDSMTLGYLVSWLVLLLPVGLFTYGLAATLHRRAHKKREADFPSARVVD